MRKTLVVAAVGMFGFVIVTGFSAFALAAPKGPAKHAATATILGAVISEEGTSFESVHKVTSSVDGTGAGIEDGSITGTTPTLSGNGTITDYFADGVLKAKETFRLGAPNASGIAAITGSGKCVGGTRVHRNQKCTYTFTGTENVKTLIIKVKITGT
jgi:hypothetical protein